MSQTVVSKGIFHGLPTYSNLKNESMNVIVTGANGISGSAMVKVFSEAPERWHKIYALSRKLPNSVAKNVIPVAVDFLHSTPQEIAEILVENKVEADYVLFASYIQSPPTEGKGLWSDTDVMTEQNQALLSNFLDGLKLAKITPRRILLQTGAKWYGLHLGPTPSPMEEQDLRHGIEPNFYFGQEDALAQYCKEAGSAWVSTRPGFILGAVQTAAMNIVYPLAVYAAVQSHLGNALEFPGDALAWVLEKHQSSAALIAYHAEWALLTPEAKNEFLNQSDGSSFSWGKFWPVLARWYGLKVGFPAEDADSYDTITMPYAKPPRGFGGPGIIKASFSFLEWSKKPEVLQAWEELTQKYDLKGSPFGDKAMDNFGLIDGEILGSWGRVISMDKNRKLGWHGFVDSKEAIRSVIDDMARLRMIPPPIPLQQQQNGL